MTATQTRPTWTQLTPAQQTAAFNMNQDNFEQSGLSRADEWQEFMACFETEQEFTEMMANLNRQAANL